MRKARKWAKLTQGELAKKAKVHPNTISDIERGLNIPGLKVGLDIAEALGVHIKWLTGQLENHRQGVQVDSDEEMANWLAYKAMSPEEKRELVDFMTDLHRAKDIARGGAEKAKT